MGGRLASGERPLGLYDFGDDTAIIDRVLAATNSGGACVNTCTIQSALPSMGFGRSGRSGMGRHNGTEGFRESSNARGVLVRGEGDDLLDAFYPPYAKAEALVDAALGRWCRPRRRMKPPPGDRRPRRIHAFFTRPR